MYHKHCASYRMLHYPHKAVLNALWAKRYSSHIRRSPGITTRAFPNVFQSERAEGATRGCATATRGLFARARTMRGQKCEEHNTYIFLGVLSAK